MCYMFSAVSEHTVAPWRFLHEASTGRLTSRTRAQEEENPRGAKTMLKMTKY